MVRVEIEGLNSVLRNLDLTNVKIRSGVRKEIIGTAFDVAADVKEDENFPVITGRLYSSYSAFHEGAMEQSYQVDENNRSTLDKNPDKGKRFVATLRGFKIMPGDISAAAGSNVEYAFDIEHGIKKSTGNFKLAHAFQKNQNIMMRKLKMMFK